MLKPYRGMYAAGIARAKEASSSLRRNQSKLEGSEVDLAGGWGVVVPAHVCISDSLAAWVPLDRALDVCSAVLAFLSEKQMQALHRQIEHEALFLTKHGELEEAEGAHTVIRAAFRRILKSSGAELKRAEDSGGEEATTIVVNMEKVLQA